VLFPGSSYYTQGKGKKKKEAEKHLYGVCICYETVTKVRCMQNESMTKPDAISGIFSLELQEHPPQ